MTTFRYRQRCLFEPFFPENLHMVSPTSVDKQDCWSHRGRYNDQQVTAGTRIGPKIRRIRGKLLFPATLNGRASGAFSYKQGCRLSPFRLHPRLHSGVASRLLSQPLVRKHVARSRWAHFRFARSVRRPPDPRLFVHRPTETLDTLTRPRRVKIVSPSRDLWSGGNAKLAK